MRNPPSRWTRALAAAVCASPLLLTAGCVTEGPKPPPRVTFQEPANPVIEQMVMNTHYPRDTDGNGHPDTMDIFVHLFEADGKYPLSVTARGTFVFEMSDSQGKQVGRWVFTPELAAERKHRDRVGPCYLFRVSLLEPGMSDRLSTEYIDLRGHFVREDGVVVRPSGVISQYFGRVR
ncbi:MAG: hypothetical protein HRU70_14945 [Phycisphaeraceae bacterium]|nr:MAG: hypothetical protein HRU70_14945 [Phycisphaeraceae bacterium]